MYKMGTKEKIKEVPKCPKCNNYMKSWEPGEYYCRNCENENFRKTMWWKFPLGILLFWIAYKLARISIGI